MTSSPKQIHTVSDEEFTNAADASQNDRRVLDPLEAAALIRVEARTLIRWARFGYVPAHPLGEGKRKFWRFFEDELLEWLHGQSSGRRRPVTRSIEKATSAHARRTA